MPQAKAVFLFLVLTACAGSAVLTAGCATYRNARLQMPEVTAKGEFLAWFVALDAGMAAACR